MSEIDPTSELEQMLEQEFSGKASEPPPEAPPEDAPVVVHDAPPDQQEAPPEEPDAAPTPAEPGGEPDATDEGEEVEAEGDPYVAWATKKYGDDPDKWAKAARDMESHISRLTEEKHASDELAQQWYDYAQSQSQQAQQQLGMGMPLSAQEEQYAEAALTNPLEYARQAAFQGRVPLYNAVIERVAQENPMLAAQIGTQVQVELQQWAQQETQQAAPAPTLEQSLGGSFQRLGINLEKDGPKMSEKLSELGEYHPYVRAILGGNDAERDLAVQAVHDLTRAGNLSTRRTEREQNIKREEELRHEAMAVQTGSQAPPMPTRQPSAMEQGMQEEWKRSGAWPYADE